MSMIPITEMRDLLKEYTNVDCTDIEDGNVLIMYQAQLILEDHRTSKSLKRYARFNFNSAANATIDTRETLRKARRNGKYKEEHDFGAFGAKEIDLDALEEQHQRWLNNAAENAPTYKKDND